MKIATKDLTGAALDWAVASALGWTNFWIARRLNAPDAPMIVWTFDVEVYDNVAWQPTLNWAQGGPIIEREKIQLTPLNQDNPKYGWAAAYKDRGEWGDDLFSVYRQRGITPLIAAMRCYVASKLGDEVGVPEELLS